MEIVIAVAVLIWMGGAVIVVGLCNAAARGDVGPGRRRAVGPRRLPLTRRRF